MAVFKKLQLESRYYINVIILKRIHFKFNQSECHQLKFVIPTI